MASAKTPFPPGAHVATYLRDSGGDRQELSVPRQESEIRDWCAANGLILTQVFKDEARPGSSVVGRTGFQAMMRHFRSHDCQDAGLIIWNYQRFARDIDDSQFFRADLRRNGFIFFSVNDEIPEGPIGRLFEAALDWKNEQFLVDLSADVKSGLRRLVERYGGVPGTPPRGFVRSPIAIGKSRDGSERIVHRWEPDPELIDRVRQAWEMRAAGKSLAEIHRTTHLYGSINSYTTFYRNRIYIGILDYADETYEDYCDPIVDQKTWEAVQRLVKKNAGRKNLKSDGTDHPRRVASSYLYSGLVCCGLCGATLAGQSAKQRNGTYHENYRCSRAKRRRDCTAKAIPRLPLEKVLLETLQEFILQPEVLQACQDATIRELAERDARLAEAKALLHGQLGPVRRKIANTTHAIAEMGHSRALLDSLARLEAEEADLLGQIAQIERQAGAPIVERSPVQIAALTDNLTAALQSADPDRIRTILRGFVERIYVHREGDMIKGMITYYYPPEDIPKKAPAPKGDETASSFLTPLGAQKQPQILAAVLV